MISDPGPFVVLPCLSFCHSGMFLRLDWCDPGSWRCHFRCRCWQLLILKFGRVLKADVSSIFRSWRLVENWKLKFGSYFVTEVWFSLIPHSMPGSILPLLMYLFIWMRHLLDSFCSNMEALGRRRRKGCVCKCNRNHQRSEVACKSCRISDGHLLV